MPVRNAGGFLVDAIKSIQNQTYTNWELICINDGSTDSSAAILTSFRKNDKRIVIITNKKKRGISYSLNRGIEKTRGEFIARQDADDISLPERLEKQINLLSKNPDVVACGGQAAMINEQGVIFAYKKFPTDSEALYKMIMRVVPIQHPILMTRASAMKQYRYIESYTTAEDVDLFFYLLSKGDFSNVASVIYKYRKTDNSNGYHNVKKTFMITFQSRLNAIINYGYKPTVLGVTTSLLQFVIVSLLPSRYIVKFFEIMRYDPPLWVRPFTYIAAMLTTKPQVRSTKIVVAK